MANRKAYKDEVKSKNRRRKKVNRKKKQGGFFHSLGVILGSKVFRTLFLFVFAAGLGAAGTYLWMDSQPSQETVLASMNGKTITVNDVYQLRAGATVSKENLQQIIFTNILEDKYGKKVSSNDVQKRFDEEKKGIEDNGQDFNSLIESNNFTEDSFKDYIRYRLMEQKALEAAAKKEMTDKELQKSFKSYSPEVTVTYFSTAEKSKAESIKKSLSAKDANMDSIVSENQGQPGISYDSGTRYDSDRSSTLPPNEVQDATFKLKKDGVTDVIEVKGNDNSKMYYVAKVTKKTEKQEDWKSYEKRLKEIFVSSRLSDQDFVNKVMAGLLKEYNVTIEDDNYNSLLTDYGLSAADTNVSTSKSSTGLSSSKK